MYKEIILSNPRYGITGTFHINKELYEKHYAMHPIRPEEALQSELPVCYGHGTPVTEKMIEKVIEDEYEIANNIGNIINEARGKFAIPEYIKRNISGINPEDYMHC